MVSVSIGMLTPLLPAWNIITYIRMSWADYIDCENTSDSWESLFKRLIYVDADGYLAVRTTCSEGAGDSYIDCMTNSDSVDSLIRRLMMLNDDGNLFLNT